MTAEEMSIASSGEIDSSRRAWASPGTSLPELQRCIMVIVNKRARRRERRLKEAEEAKVRFRFGVLADKALREHSFDDLGFQVVDVEVLSALDGSPGGMSAFLIFPTVQAAQAAREPETSAQLLQRARDVLAASGFPADALATFDLAYTSLPEIQAAGGRFSYFR